MQAKIEQLQSRLSDLEDKLKIEKIQSVLTSRSAKSADLIAHFLSEKFVKVDEKTNELCIVDQEGRARGCDLSGMRTGNFKRLTSAFLIWRMKF